MSVTRKQNTKKKKKKKGAHFINKHIFKKMSDNLPDHIL